MTGPEKGVRITSVIKTGEHIVTKIRDKDILFGNQNSALWSFLNQSLRSDTVVNDCLSSQCSGDTGRGVGHWTRSHDYTESYSIVYSQINFLMNTVKSSRTVSQSQKDHVLSGGAGSC